MQLRSLIEQALCELAAVHRWHHDVGEQQMNGLGKTSAELERLGSSAGWDYTIALQLEDLVRNAANLIVVFDEEQRFIPQGWRARRFIRVAARNTIERARQIDVEASASPYFGLEQDVTGALFDDAVHRRKAQARPPPLRLGRIKWLERARGGGLIHPDAGVTNAQHDPAAWPDTARVARCVALELRVARLDHELAP